MPSSSSSSTSVSPKTPELTMSVAPTPQRTNTLIITQLTPAFFNPGVQDALRDHFASYGLIHTWAPLKAFRRVLVVYYMEDDAERAKSACDYLVIAQTQHSPETTLRVYRADRTSIEPSSPGSSHNNFLRPPEIEKNFLISPPGSPPVGWEPIREDPPNAAPLADDLINALRKLQLQTHTTQGVEVLLEPEDGVGISVFVEDCDGGDGGRPIEDEDWVYGEASPARQRWQPLPTAMPPPIAGY